MSHPDEPVEPDYEGCEFHKYLPETECFACSDAAEGRAMTNYYIPKDELNVGMAYYVDARNFSYALWDGYQFVGLRFKFGDVFTDTELHWDDGPPHGTAKPLKLLTKGSSDE